MYAYKILKGYKNYGANKVHSMEITDTGSKGGQQFLHKTDIYYYQIQSKYLKSRGKKVSDQGQAFIYKWTMNIL